MMKFMMYSICVLCATVVILCDIAVTQKHLQDPMIIKTINTTTIIGESIVFDCAENTEFHNISDAIFNWTFNGKHMKHDRKLLENNRIVNIINITIDDKGKYECGISNQIGFYYISVFVLNVADLTNQIIHGESTVKYTNHVGRSLNWTCNTFDDDSTYEYTWFKDKKALHSDINGNRISLGNNNMSLRITNIINDDKGTYVCNASNKLSTDSTVFVFSVIYQPRAKILDKYDEHTTRYINESVSWSCSITSNHQEVNNYKYSWFKNGVPLYLSKKDQRLSLIMDNSTLKINNLNHKDTGFYFCNVSNGLVSGSYNRTLTVKDSPKRNNYAWYFSNLKLIINTTVQLRCKTLHSSIKFKTTFKWLKNNKPLISSGVDGMTSFTNNNETLVLKAIKAGKNVTYTCEASNVYHTFYSAYTYDIIETEMLKFYNESNQTTVRDIGESIELWCYVHGMPPPHITWYKNGKPFYILENDKSRVLLQESNQSLLINEANLKDGGHYECRALNRIDICVATFELVLKGSHVEKKDGLFTSNASYIFYGVVIGILTLCVLVDFIRKRRRRAMLKQSLITSSKASNTEINYVKFDS